jgi:hypothetical protein
MSSISINEINGLIHKYLMYKFSKFIKIDKSISCTSSEINAYDEIIDVLVETGVLKQTTFSNIYLLKSPE